MNKKEHIHKLIEEAINSVDNAKRAAPMPYLLTRINARLNKTKENAWDKAGWFIGKPAIAIPALAMLILVNVLVISINGADPFAASTEQAFQSPGDEFTYRVSAFYDIENNEP
jgi:hypothetical protein